MAAIGQPLFGPSVGLERAVAAVNAAGPPCRLDSRAARMRSFADVLRATGEPGSLAGIAAAGAAIESVLAELHAIFAAPDTATAAQLLNAGLARHTGPLRLVDEPGAAWHLHAEPPGQDTWAGWLAATSLLAMAVHFAERGGPAWGVCAAHDCGRVFAVTGPGRARTTCSPRCGTLKRQTEFRARRRRAAA
jgi:CGNR zinc finger